MTQGFAQQPANPILGKSKRGDFKKTPTLKQTGLSMKPQTSVPVEGVPFPDSYDQIPMVRHEVNRHQSFQDLYGVVGPTNPLEKDFASMDLAESIWAKEPSSAVNEPNFDFLDDDEEVKDPLFGLDLNS